MNNDIPIPAHAKMTQYDHIQCVHSTKGLVLRAQRVVVDETTPIRWKMLVEGSGWRDLMLTQDGTRETYATSELVEFAKNAGFGEWQQPARAMVADRVTGHNKPVYTPPDPTPYAVD